MQLWMPASRFGADMTTRCFEAEHTVRGEFGRATALPVRGSRRGRPTEG
jgi:hypothetical protein